MKLTPLFIFVGFFLADVSLAAVPGPQDSSPVALPDDSLSTTTRGSMTVCGRKGIRFMQIDKAACPHEPSKAVGWDRPQVEPVSPGVPFQDQGIERF
ncbi:hypothetical protein AZI86_08425 [Bdellovibrio bacteriovorus]|uniref:Uncharacterized protein n=1 Tax=Bdellovibrio bacteriovorus TaxID=959 RepID=A0A150WRB2_BDEBC|nr:hypothetical protein [Bdellovibrio bacteriovorus]KYG67031.1 hypothetical protein AZI86_08425 [Bdellovibrio bacteriovorus]